MKINYKQIIHSTNIDSSTLIKNITSELNKSRYEIKSQTLTKVEFEDDSWMMFGSRAARYKTIDGGIFEIMPDRKTVILSYYLSSTPGIIASLIVVFSAIIQDFHIFFLIIPIALAFYIRLVSIKMAAENMMEKILNTELP